MKTILVLTDFSINADYMAQYALALAQKIEAKLLVCNIYEAPNDQDRAEHNDHPFATDEEDSMRDLGAVVAHLKTRLDMQKESKSYRPEIEQCSVEGPVGGQLLDILLRHKVIFAMVSAHCRGNYVDFLRIDNTWAIIDNANFPVLVIPYQVRFKPYHEIGFANSILEASEEHGIRQFFEELPFDTTYHYLKQSAKSVNIDLLVIVHHKRNFFQRLFNGSMTHKLATRSNTPLLVFPGTYIKEAIGALQLNSF